MNQGTDRGTAILVHDLSSLPRFIDHEGETVRGTSSDGMSYNAFLHYTHRGILQILQQPWHRDGSLTVGNACEFRRPVGPGGSWEDVSPSVSVAVPCTEAIAYGGL